MAPISKSLVSTSRNFLTTAASVAATLVLARSVINDLIPYEIRDNILSGIQAFQSRFSSMLTITIQETEGFTPNQIYTATKTYLATKIPPSTKRLSVSKQGDEKNITVAVEQGEEIIDLFQGIQFKWQLLCQQVQMMNPNNYQHSPPETRSFELSFHQKHKDIALSSYLPYILEQAKSITDEEKTLNLYMNEGDYWTPITLRHPATFDTLAMESETKRAVMEDLARFIKRKDYYKKIGKAWKRGYLLHGPPGTGKSSLIGAMANYLKFDIYDLELTEVKCNATLRSLLVGMANRSILVVEDIDCSIDLQNRESEGQSHDLQNRKSEGRSQDSQEDKVTLSGLLNFVDGLWSSCGEERIIVFTTNYKERLDPALIRPGRMDMHIHMGNCTPQGFRVLASNYHSIDYHPLFAEIEELIQEVEVSPAQVAEELLKSDDAQVSLEMLIKFLREQRETVDAAKDERESIDVLQENVEEGNSEAERPHVLQE